MQKILNVCPGTIVEGLPKEEIASNSENNLVWGYYLSLFYSWSTDKKVRFESSTGGLLNGLSLYLLELKKVKLNVTNIKSVLLDGKKAVDDKQKDRQDFLDKLAEEKKQKQEEKGLEKPIDPKKKKPDLKSPIKSSMGLMNRIFTFVGAIVESIIANVNLLSNSSLVGLSTFEGVVSNSSATSLIVFVLLTSPIIY